MNQTETVANHPGGAITNVDEVLTIDSHKDDEADAPTSRSTSWPPFNLRCPLPVSVEPVMFLTMFSVILQGPLSIQYLWDRISEDVGYNGSKRSECSNDSGPLDPLQQEVETLTAHWNLYISLANFSAGLLMLPFLGSWSDVAGRRTVLILPNLGLAIQAAIYLVVMYLKLPLFYILVATIISGLSGDFGAILAGCFSYVADISDRKSLTFRAAVLVAFFGFSGMLASIIGGQWRQAQGYINPFWLVVATYIASALYAYLFVRESVTIDPSAKLLSSRHYKAVWHLLSTGGSSSDEDARFHRYKLWLYMLCFFIVLTAHCGSTGLYVLYELSSPLCWGPALIGYGSAALYLTYLTSLLGLKIMQCCLADSWLALVGLASNITGLVVFSVADTTPLMFTGYGLSLFTMATASVIRSKLSKLVAPSEQGALFASVACVESLCLLVGSSLFNTLYPATRHFMKGFTFLFAAIILFIPAGIIWTLQCLDQRRITDTPQHPDLKRDTSASQSMR